MKSSLYRLEILKKTTAGLQNGALKSVYLQIFTKSQKFT